VNGECPLPGHSSSQLISSVIRSTVFPPPHTNCSFNKNGHGNKLLCSFRMWNVPRIDGKFLFCIFVSAMFQPRVPRRAPPPPQLSLRYLAPFQRLAPGGGGGGGGGSFLAPFPPRVTRSPCSPAMLENSAFFSVHRREMGPIRQPTFFFFAGRRTLMKKKRFLGKGPTLRNESSPPKKKRGVFLGNGDRSASPSESGSRQKKGLA